jgi:pSer/pThr/pTyr-binding forkhead associated (FHA) protein
MPELHLVRLAPDGWDDAGGTTVINRFPCLVGRDPVCDFLLDHPMVSRRHCRLRLWAERVWVEDLGSLNGTRLNGKLLTRAAPLADGDRLDLSDVTLVVGVGDRPGCEYTKHDAGAADSRRSWGRTFVERVKSLLPH